ncbi:NUDIX domain-containing protein [Flexibacterium corallicola]|uniref:NUDIX domain-containing protein n=1 Tax=Flexibacterium corallicola TaxID=3037259 RepID=UPI00286F19F6|nr:NUDIX domain-containing protein [Pseudovibrio sp. M1P-2-3]
MTLGVRVVVLDGESRVLLVKHTYLKGWYLPGGGVEKGETLEDAARRELKEEAGINTTHELELKGIYYNRGGNNRDHVALYLVKTWKRDQSWKRPSLEIVDAQFYPLSALPEGTSSATKRRLEEIQGTVPQDKYW